MGVGGGRRSRNGCAVLLGTEMARSTQSSPEWVDGYLALFRKPVRKKAVSRCQDLRYLDW